MNLKSKIVNPKKMISTFLGIFVLVGGLALGITLVEQPQLLNQKAADVEYNVCTATGLVQCADSNTIQVCAGGKWNKTACPSGQACVKDKCILATTCSSGQTRCSGTSVEVCSSGVWHTSPCPSDMNACSNGKCIAPIPPAHGCFLPGTKVQTSSGDVNIEDIKLNTKVLSFNDQSDKVDESLVSDIYEVQRDYYYNIISNGSKVSVTAEHPFYIGSGKYVEASDLRVGNIIFLLQNGNLTPSPVIAIEKVNKPTTAYNLTVQEDHTFFANSYAVHNKSFLCIGDAVCACHKAYSSSGSTAGPDGCGKDKVNVGTANYYPSLLSNQKTVTCCSNVGIVNDQGDDYCKNNSQIIDSNNNVVQGVSATCESKCSGISSHIIIPIGNIKLDTGGTIKCDQTYSDNSGMDKGARCCAK